MAFITSSSSKKECKPLEQINIVATVTPTELSLTESTPKNDDNLSSSLIITPVFTLLASSPATRSMTWANPDDHEENLSPFSVL